MVDTNCVNCGEPWDMYGLLHDEGLRDAWKEAGEQNSELVQFNLRFFADFYMGMTEIEHFHLVKCDSCKCDPKCPECNHHLMPANYDNLNSSYNCPECKAVSHFRDTKYSPKKCSECGGGVKNHETICFWCKSNKRSTIY